MYREMQFLEIRISKFQIQFYNFQIMKGQYFLCFFLDRDLDTILVAAENLTMNTMLLLVVEPVINLKIRTQQMQAVMGRESI